MRRMSFGSAKRRQKDVADSGLTVLNLVKINCDQNWWGISIATPPTLPISSRSIDIATQAKYADLEAESAKRSRGHNVGRDTPNSNSRQSVYAGNSSSNHATYHRFRPAEIICCWCRKIREARIRPPRRFLFLFYSFLVSSHSPPPPPSPLPFSTVGGSLG